MRRFAALAALAAGLTWAGRAPAQTPAPDPIAGWELNLHGATLLDNLFESSGQSIQGGVRVLRQTSSGLAFGGNFDYVRTPDIVVGPGFGGLSANLFLYSFEVDYLVPVSARADFFVGGGFGGATVRFNDAGASSTILAESSTGQLIPVAAGFKIRNRAEDPTWAIRFDVRDNIILLATRDTGGEESQEPRNNIELSAGFSFLFGDRPGPSAGARPAGRPAPEQIRPPDADRDGVPDARDQCPATPVGETIDSFGCPPPADSDEDGVPDPGDRCPGTPVGAAVDRGGCPLAPAEERPPAAARDANRDGVPEAAAPREARPVARAAEPQDTDGDGVADPADRCVNTPSGVRVDGRGCPIAVDQDRDGVVGAADHCPGTPAGAAVDARGCPLPEAEREEGEPSRPAREPEPEKPRPEPPERQPAPPEAAAGQPARPGAPAACVDAREWYQAGAAIEFQGRRWKPSGRPEPINLENLEMIGVHDGVPVFVGGFAPAPYSDVWFPRCTPSGTYHLYVLEESGP